MQLIFIYGHAAAGKLTVGRYLARLTGLPLFHNHLVVDAVGALFPFGSVEFVRLREAWWMDAFAAAAKAGQSIIFTFAPESTVAPDFPERVRSLIEGHGGKVLFVALQVSPEDQEKRLDVPSRSEFGKLRSLELLCELRPSFDASLAAMPRPDISIDTGVTVPEDAARQIAALIVR